MHNDERVEVLSVLLSSISILLHPTNRLGSKNDPIQVQCAAHVSGVYLWKISILPLFGQVNSNTSHRTILVTETKLIRPTTQLKMAVTII